VPHTSQVQSLLPHNTPTGPLRPCRRKADQDKPELQSHLLDGHNCSLIANTNKGRCMFVDASNLQPDMDAALSDRGIELYVAYVREGAKNPRAIGIVYRGAYVSMTVKVGGSHQL
jgi:hypothetical protein